MLYFCYRILYFFNSATIFTLFHLCLPLLVAYFLFTWFLCVSLIKPLSSWSHTHFSSSSFAVSRKQMRTLKCGLRYTGLTPWPCSVHHTPTPTTRCTEQLNIRHQSLCFISPPWLTCSFFCWHACYHTTLRLASHSCLNSLHRLRICRCF